MKDSAPGTSAVYRWIAHFKEVQERIEDKTCRAGLEHQCVKEKEAVCGLIEGNHWLTPATTGRTLNVKIGSAYRTLEN